LPFSRGHMTLDRIARAGRAMPILTFFAWAACHAQPTDQAAIAHPAQWRSMPPSPLVTPATDSIVDGLLSHMSLEEKIGQMVQADIASISPDDLRQYKLGSILAGGLSAPGGNLQATPAAWRSMVAAYKQAALADPAIPILFGIDAVHGNAKLRGATIFPHNIGLGAAHDPDLMRRIGAVTAQEVSAIGIDWAFAPTLAVARDMRWGRAYESYSDAPALVAAYAGAMVTGLQGQVGTPDFFAPGHVLASAKHFLGDGGTDHGRDQGNTLASEQMLRDIHGAGYRAALAAGVGSVMASYNSWQGEKMHANASLLTGVLKGRWQFGGFVVGDWNAQEEIPGCTKFSCAEAVNAGIDMVMAPDGWKQMYDNLLQQARAGIIPPARIDDAVKRILRVKALAGLIGPVRQENGAADQDRSPPGAPDHRALAREAVRKSLVLLKNEAGMLPLARGVHVLVAGDAADDIGAQCGGWTVDWQGAHNKNSDIPGATSIFAGIKAAVEQGGGTAELNAEGAFTRKPEVAIVVFGESPYAEFEGDRENLLLPHANRVLAVLQRLHAHHIPVVSVFLSGRPLWVNPELNLSDAFVAAWLPGSEGEGIADLLFRPAPGGSAHDFTGRLSFPWPATAMPVTYDAKDGVSGALFPRDYGLDMSHPQHVGQLAEDPQIPPMWNTTDTFYGAGHVIAPWSVYIADHLAQTRLTRDEQSSPAGIVQTRQEGDTIRATWSGKGEGSWWIGDTQIDLALPAKAGAVLSLTYRMLQAPTQMMGLGMQCGEGCAGWLDVTRDLRVAGWQTLRVPLTCFAASGAALDRITAPIVLRSSGRADIALREVAIEPAKPDAACPRK
jgi:beta-glucosidase